MAVSQPWKTKAWNELVRRRSSVANMSCVLSGSGVTFHDFMYYKSCSIMLKTPGVFSFFFNHKFWDKIRKYCGAKVPQPFQWSAIPIVSSNEFLPHSHSIWERDLTWKPIGSARSSPKSGWPWQSWCYKKGNICSFFCLKCVFSYRRPCCL